MPCYECNDAVRCCCLSRLHKPQSQGAAPPTKAFAEMSLAPGSNAGQTHARTSKRNPVGCPTVSAGPRRRQFWFSFYAHLILYPRNAAYWDDSSREQFLSGLGTTFPPRTLFKHPRAQQMRVTGRNQGEDEREWKVQEIHALAKPVSMADAYYQHRIPGCE